MDLKSVANLPNFLYSCLYYLMGNNVIAEEILQMEETCDKGLRNLYRGYHKLLKAYMNNKPSIININHINQNDEIRDIFNLLDSVIYDGKFYDEKIYHRKWLKLNPNEIDEIKIVDRLQGIFFYLLRGELSFVVNKPLIGSSVAASKCALNDMSQAERLIHDLYLPSLIHENGNFFSFKEQRQTGQIFEKFKMSWDYLFFILLCLVRISKARIYKDISFPEDALDNYFTALRLIESSHIKIAVDKLYCPAIINSYFDVSKLLFDKGHILESFNYQLETMYKIVEASYNVKKDRKLHNAKNNIGKAIEILKTIKNYFVEDIKKDILLSIFLPKKCIDKFYKVITAINGSEISPVFLENKQLISPLKLNKLSDNIIDYLRPMLSDLLARIGFTLYTIRERIQDDKFDQELKDRVAENNLNDAIEAYETYMQSQIKEYFKGIAGYPTELGTYTRIVQGENIEFTSKKIERVLCSSALAEIKEQEEGRGIKFICNKMAKHTLANIGNIASIPLRVSLYLMQGSYKSRTKDHPFKRDLLNKLVILRRWQSYNPKVPRPKGQDIRGGGYFLFWEGKGIVIDPGFNFLQNFYEEGFSIEDVDAVLITHAHPDHDDELNSILTMLAEWNKYQETEEYVSKDSKSYTKKTIDLFLNEGAYRKYNNWLYAKDVMIGKIFILQSSQWDKRSEKKNTFEKKFGENPFLDLRERYNFMIRVTPSWHDELIDKHSSVGIIFDLYKKGDDQKIESKIGITGDTEWYSGIDIMFSEVDILISHVGDIKFRELLSHLDGHSRIFSRFISSWFKVGLLDEDILDILRDYLLHRDIYGLEKNNRNIKISKKTQLQEIKKMEKNEYAWVQALTKYCIPIGEYTYKNHLGINGIYKMFNSLVKHNNQGYQKLMVMGELPEELQSYRQFLACSLEEQEQSKKVRCLTGDIGLTIGLPTNTFEFGRPAAPNQPNPKFAVRCMKCNQNNEYVKGDRDDINGKTYLYHYHALDAIQETCLIACHSRIVWFCTDHAANPDYARLEYVIKPDLRTVWG